MVALEIADTGLDKVNGTEIYVKVNSGEYLTLYSNVLRSEFTVQTTDNSSYRKKDDSNITFHSNELTAVLPPRFTINAFIPVDNTDDISNVIALRNSKGIKKLKGGLGLINASPDNFDDSGEDAIYVLLKNLTLNEVLRESTNYLKMTLQLEQVR